MGNQHVLSNVVDVDFQAHFGVGQDFLFGAAPNSRYGGEGVVVKIYECEEYELKDSHTVWRVGA